ncbi:MAG: Hsp70 family protein [Phycisphaerales bacterium]|nr:Hsp70 family protein [Phycisphaerales bacterium]
MDETATGNTNPIIGIDLGTTNSLAAFADERGPRILGDSAGGSGIVPSVVRYEPQAAGSFETIVGLDARERAIEFPLHTVASAKRLMGRSLQDAAGDAPYLPYQLVSGPRDMAAVAIPRQGSEPLVVTPQQVSAQILRAVRDKAEQALGVPVERAVVTVPAYFDDGQRQATRDAGRLAGLEVVRIVSEPTAAALAYGLGSAQRAKQEPTTVAVYDLGGGTFDISILRITPSPTEGAPAIFQVLATDGDSRLGGDDADHTLVELFLTEINERFGLGLPEDIAQGLAACPPQTRRALLTFAQDVKHRLSEEESAAVAIDLGEGRVYDRTIARTELEERIEPWIARSLAACDRAKRQAAKQPGGETIDAVVLVGGSTRVPAVRRAVGDFFGMEPYTALDPDRVVALGAAVQAATLAGVSRNSLLLDAIPLSLGIETVGGAVAKLIHAGATVPARARETFSTSVDNQTAIELKVLQGEREMAEDCRALGEFRLRGIPPMPAGVPQLQVEFLVDANGVLNVSAIEQRSGETATLQIIPNHGLTRDEVDSIEAEAIEHARDDMTRHRIVDLVAHAALDIKWINDAMVRAGEALDVDTRAQIEGVVREVSELAERAKADWRSVDADAFYRAKQAMDEASVPLHEAAISQSLKGLPSDATGPRQNPDR